MIQIVVQNVAAEELGNWYGASFQVPEENRAYLMAFYIHGLMAIVDQWLQNDCADSIQKISAIMQQCVARPDLIP